MFLRSSAFMALAKYHVRKQIKSTVCWKISPCYLFHFSGMVGFCPTITAIIPSNSFLNIYILIYKLKAMINLASLTVRSIF